LKGKKPDLIRTVKQVAYEKTGGNWPGFTRSNNFAVRWIGLITIKKFGKYTFSLESDDGSKLLIDSQMVVNNDGLHSMKKKEAVKQLSNGPHSIQLLFFEKGGHAGMLFKYAGPDTGDVMRIVPENVLLPVKRKIKGVIGKAKATDQGLKEQVYYLKKGTRRLPKLKSMKAKKTRTDKQVNYASTRRKWPGLTRANNFAVRWTGYLSIRNAGLYTFSLRSDDGSKLFIDRTMIVNNDGLHGMRTRSGKMQLSNLAQVGHRIF
jgi:hypothetical protein